MTDSLVQALADVSARQPQAPALVWRGATWSFGELTAAIASVRSALIERGVAPGDRIALLLRNSPQYVALYYGILAAGCIAVPLNPHERAAALRIQLEHCGASVVLGDPNHPEWAALTAAMGSSLQILAIELEDGDDAAERIAANLGASGQPESGDFAAPCGHAPAAIIYTSGTTGRPKGVLLSHRNLYRNARAIMDYLDLTPDDRGLCVLPFHFSYGNSVLHTHLLSGACLYIEDNLVFPHVTLERIQNEGITSFAGVPSTFALLLGRCELADYELGSLRRVTQAGGAMAPSLIERLRQALPEAELFVMYGQTEASARLTYLPPERLDDKLGSVGIPITGVEIEIRGPDGATVPPGVVGELHARGPNIMLGYWNDPDATAQVLKDGWLATGDLAHQDSDGFLFVRGRASEMIKVGAYRVSPLEVEEVITALPQVQEVAVTGMSDEMLGQAVRAVVVLENDQELDERSVKAHCRKHLASYKIPKAVEFVTELPKTSSGKVKKFAIAEEGFPQ